MGIPERKLREKKQRKEEILETARHLFEERGFLNVTMGEIAEATEVSTGTLYLYFKNKDDFYAALACLGSQKIDNLIGQMFHEAKGLTHEKVVSFIKHFLNLYSDYGSYFDVLKLNWKGKGRVNLSDEYVDQLRVLTLSSLTKSFEYFSGQFPEKPEKSDSARATTFALWAFLLGLAQILDVGRTDLFSEEDIDRLLHKAADFILDMPIEITSR